GSVISDILFFSITAFSGRNQHEGCKVCSPLIELKCTWRCGGYRLQTDNGSLIRGYEDKAKVDSSCLVLLNPPNCTSLTSDCIQHDGRRKMENVSVQCEDPDKPDIRVTDHFTWWQILFIVIGAVAVVAAVIGIAICLCKRRQKGKAGRPPSNTTDNGNARGETGVLLPPSSVATGTSVAAAKTESSVTNSFPEWLTGCWGFVKSERDKPRDQNVP
ncbi:hypothetical protein XENTR_v10020171, partial [Xenopus tropicalis]